MKHNEEEPKAPQGADRVASVDNKEKLAANLEVVRLREALGQVIQARDHGRKTTAGEYIRGLHTDIAKYSDLGEDGKSEVAGMRETLSRVDGIVGPDKLVGENADLSQLATALEATLKKKYRETQEK